MPPETVMDETPAEKPDKADCEAAGQPSKCRDCGEPITQHVDVDGYLFPIQCDYCAKLDDQSSPDGDTEPA